MLPETAPFPADQIVALNRIISGSSAEQRTWLSGFLAGYQAANAPQPAAAAPPARRVPLTILFGTESGNAEALAMSRAKPPANLGSLHGCWTWRMPRRRKLPAYRTCW